ncbi:hypothetical protein ERX27_07585 [Macrococcus brunensis]|uniref:Uncharacterized protein n=1 Tax=Macrococcus brunensis TaxID=198483 RepID=A0A4R6BCZ4_9STAP|nr:hypothetical protein [Macrococcus brunensis]TDL96708.1 hypothetical protein ERX27_07585 [Macrococcus brunensis]
MNRTDSDHNKWLYEQDGTVAANTIMMRSGVQFVGCSDKHPQMEYMRDSELVNYMQRNNLYYKEQLKTKSKDTRSRRQPDLFEVMRDYAK